MRLGSMPMPISQSNQLSLTHSRQQFHRPTNAHFQMARSRNGMHGSPVTSSNYENTSFPQPSAPSSAALELSVIYWSMLPINKGLLLST